MVSMYAHADPDTVNFQPYDSGFGSKTNLEARSTTHWRAALAVVEAAANLLIFADAEYVPPNEVVSALVAKAGKLLKQGSKSRSLSTMTKPRKETGGGSHLISESTKLVVPANLVSSTTIETHTIG
eukprot:7387371-Prymnesium_polylepis.1